MANKFVHLHLHTEYSLLDGMSKIKDLFTHVKENDMDTVAITDHGVMYGVVEFYKKAQDAQIKPIIGMEAYTTNIDLDKRPERNKFKNFHLLLLAKNNEGYKNLMKLTSIAHLEGYYYRPRITREILAKHANGLICSSACPAGELATSLIDGQYDEARKTAQWFLDVFGDNYYLEIQRHNYKDYIDTAINSDVKQEITKMANVEEIINKGVLKLSRELAIPIIATNDSHYIKKEDAQAQDALVCIATGKDVSDTKRLRFIDTPEYYVKSPSEMIELFRDVPDAIENTVKIAEKCEIEIKLGEWFFPKIDIPKGSTPDSELKKLAVEGLKKRYAEITPELKRRLAYEIKVIIDKGYPEYFLIYKDMTDWAAKNKIPINTRGSAAGSLVSYCLGITTVDPIRYVLPFERFLNPLRPSAPDIDLDISDTKREKMIAYLTKKYGEDKVAQISTFGRMLAKGSVRDVARVLGYPYNKGDELSKLIPLGSQGFPMSIDRAFKENPDFKAQYDTDADSKRIIDLAKQIEGNARHISVHAAGVVISPTKMTDFTPVRHEPSGDKVITQYEMHACEDVGLIKLDILGIRNLSILEESIHLTKQVRNVDVDLSKIPLDDKKTFEMLTRGETFGVFQMGGSGMTKWLMELAPERIEDINAMIALYRPGPMANIPDYIARKKGNQEIVYAHPKMEKYLDKSFGILVYQDDLLYTALELAGYDWKEVDKFRKAVGKKIPEEMALQHIKFVDGCVEFSNMTKEEAEDLWKLFEPFQGYGFNKAHAASYGMVSYQTAYMKANYTVEYMCALLTAESNDIDKVSEAIAECRRLGIKVLAPDINESGTAFTVVKDEDSLDKRAIRFGLEAIKNVGQAAIEAILEVRKDNEFSSFLDFLKRVDARKVNKKVLESLIKVGAMSRFGTRASLLGAMDEMRNKVAKPKGFENQQGLFGVDEVKTSITKESDDILLNAEEFSKDEMANFERELMGFALSAKPLGEIIGPLKSAATHNIDEIVSENSAVKNVKIAAIIDDIRLVVTKKSGKEMAFVRCKDETGAIDLVVFPTIYTKAKAMLFENQPVLITGKMDMRDDSISILVDEIDTIESLKQGTNTFNIRIPEGVDAEQLKQLKKILLDNPGSQKVCLIFEGSNSRRVDLNFGITWSENLSALIAYVFVKPVLIAGDIEEPLN
ncbi:DNA polymerase III subunit alpha [Candidatus Woesebacteria bacterium]|nr:MAG: DNA polymerase III subunit alpha [Candidatus Woesebacteria bacterium]